MHIKKAFQICFLLFSFIFQNTYSQPNFPPPSGVYCSCGPTTGMGNGSVDPLVAEKPFVQGILVRMGWNLVEPIDNSYNWALIDGQIAAANSFGKKVSLGIGCGIAIPDWVFDSGAQRLVTSIPFVDTIAVPWDPVFLNKWTEFVSAFGNHYQNDTTIQLVYMTASTGNGFEMQLPFVTSPTLSAIGISDSIMIASWKIILDAFNGAFPNHYLTNDFHPVNGSNVVADSVYAYAVSTIGNRYGANAWWWTQHNTTVYPSQYAILLNSAANNKFSGIQMAHNGTSDSALFGPGGMPAALELAKSNGVCYWEVWNQDILNFTFDSLLSNAICDPTGIQIKKKIEEPISVFPNPVQNSFTVEFPYPEFTLEIFDALGQRILFQKCNEGILKVDCALIQSGIYFLHLRSIGYTTFGKVIKI